MREFPAFSGPLVSELQHRGQRKPGMVFERLWTSPLSEAAD